MKRKLEILGILILLITSILFLSATRVQAYTDEEYEAKLNESVAYAMSLLDDDMTDYEKARVLAQYCQEGSVYGFGPNHQIAKGVLVDHMAVCAGYADALKLLLNTAGIPCEIVESYSANHGWNICYLDGEWTYIDNTGFDNIHECNHSKMFYSQAKFDMIKYNGVWYSGELAEEYGYEGESMFFSDAVVSNLPQLPNNTVTGGTITGLRFNSRIYYDEDYKYYNGTITTNGTKVTGLYKENRETGERILLETPLNAYNGSDSGMVKDGNTIYYVGSDKKTIKSIKTDGTYIKTELEITGENDEIGGIYISDGYIYYAKYDTTISTSEPDETIKFKELTDYVTRNSYTINNTNQKYVLNYLKTSKGIIIENCEGINGNDPVGEIYIPDTIDNLPVVGIAQNAFKNISLTGTFVLPTKLEYISEYAFYNTKIEKIQFNEKLKSIGYYAFGNNTNIIDELKLSDSITYVEQRAFANCSHIGRINFGKGLLYITSSCFSGCESLQGVIEIPEGVEMVCYNSFYGCNNIQAVILPETLIQLGRAFTNCEKLEDIWIKSSDIKYMDFKTIPNIYLPTQTHTSDYADESDIAYIDEDAIQFSNAKLSINNVTNNEKGITNLNLVLGQEETTLELDVSPKFWITYPTTWESSNSNIISVDGNGKVAAKAEGEAIITATINGKSKQITVKVEKLDTVIFNQNTINMTKGDSTTLEIVEGLSSTSTLTWKVKSMSDETVEYDITDEEITDYIKVETTDNRNVINITAVNAERANNKYQVIAYIDGKYIGICNITINIPIESIKIYPNTIGLSVSGNFAEKSSTTIDYKNEALREFSLRVQVYPTNATETLSEVEWIVANPNILQNNQDGSFKVLRGGATDITAFAGDYQRIITVTIINDDEHLLKGDVNNDGEVKLYDALQILKQAILGGDLTEDELYIMDYNDDGEVTLYDSLKFLQQAILG